MPKYVVVGAVRCVIDAVSAKDAEGVLEDIIEDMDIWADGFEIEEITISDAVEVDDD